MHSQVSPEAMTLSEHRFFWFSWTSLVRILSKAGVFCERWEGPWGTGVSPFSSSNRTEVIPLRTAFQKIKIKHMWYLQSIITANYTPILKDHNEGIKMGKNTEKSKLISKIRFSLMTAPLSLHPTFPISDKYFPLTSKKVLRHQQAFLLIPAHFLLLLKATGV